MKTKNSNGLTARTEGFRTRKSSSDPVLFAEHVLGVDLWDREAEILRSIKARAGPR